jgi:hypothetical protein
VGLIDKEEESCSPWWEQLLSLNHINPDFLFLELKGRRQVQLPDMNLALVLVGG